MQNDPNVAYVMSQVGTGGRSMNQGSLTIHLKPRSQRPQVEQVIQELRPKLAAVPGITVFLRNDPPIRIGGMQSKSLYQFTLQSANTASCYSSSQDFRDEDAAACRACRTSPATCRSRIRRSTS